MPKKHAELLQAQELIQAYVQKNLKAIRGREEGASEAVVNYAKKVTLQALLDCGCSQEVAEQKYLSIATSVLQYELFNAFIVE